MENEDLTSEERRAFESLSREASPPHFLEREVVEDLKSKGLIDVAKRSKGGWIRYPIAASVIFLLGFFAGSIADTGINKEKAYMMILFEDENFHIENPSEVAAEYGLWNAKINHSGNAMNGQELWNETLQISTNGVERLGADYSGRVSGYFILEASSEEEAISLASGSPHIKYGGTVHLKRFRVR